jgi:malate dehydrogenase (oxaloacetate-decarboxylating)(NADP+)
MIDRQSALTYHEKPYPGKIAVVPTKPTMTQLDLSLAYTPGVAEPCREIHQDPAAADRYTARRNLVAVVTNGTAVLGLGDIGPLAGKPVMEGKGLLFKRFADINVFDLELNTHDPDEIIRAVALLEPTFGGINLEDIKAPECFKIEQELKARMNIPVFHDDQHGTAIISGAALINACELTGRELSKVRMVILGAGAAGIAGAWHYMRLGVPRENIMLVDRTGVVYRGRSEGMNEYKAQFALDTACRTLADAMRDADIFIGVSGPNLVTVDMVRSMAPKPIVMAMANPDPEITYEEAKAARSDLIMATGRSDYPNQVNNVLGFPFIFRGALDVAARAINDEMMVAATRALAALAREPVPDSVAHAYPGAQLRYGPEYIIPKPFDPRVLIWEASAVAEAAMATGVARQKMDLEAYREQLESRLGAARATMRILINKARGTGKRIVLPDSDFPQVLRAAPAMAEEGVAEPVLIGDRAQLGQHAALLGVEIEGIEVLDPATDERAGRYAAELYRLRQRRGLTQSEARRLVARNDYFALMMVRQGDADGMVGGIKQSFASALRLVFDLVPRASQVRKVGGLHLVISGRDVLFMLDTTVNPELSAEDLAELTLCAVDEMRWLNVEPRVAFLSYSNFGSVDRPEARKMRRAAELFRQLAPGVSSDGEMQVNVALDPALRAEHFPFSNLSGRANLLVFPDLGAANAGYKVARFLGGADVIGPILLGLSRPVQLLQIGDHTERDIVHLATITALQAMERHRTGP